MAEDQSKDSLLSMMFSHYDKNGDEFLEKFELDQVYTALKPTGKH